MFWLLYKSASKCLLLELICANKKCFPKWRDPKTELAVLAITSSAWIRCSDYFKIILCGVVDSNDVQWDRAPPEIPISLLEVYHGYIADGYDDKDPEYETGGDLKRTKHLLEDAPMGMEERNFHDVCREMDRDPEAPVPTEVVVGGETYFQRFQQSLEVRATSSNPLDFRGSVFGKISITC